MTTKAQRDEWRELAAKASAGPWDSQGTPMVFLGPCTLAWCHRAEDASFIAEARTAVPALADEVERLREALRELVFLQDEYSEALTVDGKPPLYPVEWTNAMKAAKRLLEER